jgi:DNA-directed RNA polymerase specialized sigma24 family protein
MDTISQFYSEDEDQQKTYYIEIRDYYGNPIRIEVDQAVFLTFRHSKCKIDTQRRSDRRHVVYEDPNDDCWVDKHTEKDPVFEAVWDHIRTEELWRATNDLSDKQRRRFLLHHYCDLQFKDIAIIEGCTGQAVIESVRQAETILKKKLRYFFE